MENRNGDSHEHIIWSIELVQCDERPCLKGQQSKKTNDSRLARVGGVHIKKMNFHRLHGQTDMIIETYTPNTMCNSELTVMMPERTIVMEKTYTRVTEARVHMIQACKHER